MACSVLCYPERPGFRRTSTSPDTDRITGCSPTGETGEFVAVGIGDVDVAFAIDISITVDLERRVIGIGAARPDPDIATTDQPGGTAEGQEASRRDYAPVDRGLRVAVGR